ncbi:O-antigen ligase family protein [Georgenia satyanarayanai]|nr:O-antigen ligase family protein [Georgenia satyanarayanai]
MARQRGWLPPGIGAVVMLWGSFVPAAVMVAVSNEDLDKTLQLFTLTAVTTLTALLAGATRKGPKVWVTGQFLLALLLIPLIAIFPDHSSAARGQASIEGSNTIGIGRLLGAGVLVAVAYALVQRRHRLMFVGSGLVLATTLLLVGNRASFVSLVVALVTTGLLAQRFAAQRIRILFIILGGVFVLISLILSGRLEAAGRLRAFLTPTGGPGSDSPTVREQLLSVAVTQAWESPLGLGWGGLSDLADLRGLGENVYPHNVPVEVVAEGGWIAAAGFLAFAVMALVRLQRNSTSPVGAILLALAVYWLSASLFSEDINGNRMMWASLAIGFASLPPVRQGSASNPRLSASDRTTGSHAVVASRA